MKYLVTGYLAVNAWDDWRKKEIDCRYAAVFAICVWIMQLYKKEPLYWMGVMPGICLYILSYRKRNGVGSGDGIVTAALGWAVGIEKVWNILVGGFLLAGVFGILFWISGKRKDTEIAFVPLLFVSFFMEEWICGFT